MNKLAFIAMLAVGCAAGRAHAPMGLLVLHVTPLDARVLLDDRYIGDARQLSGHPLRVGTGLRRLEVSAERHYAARREAQITTTKRVELDIELHEVPEGERGE